MKMHLNFPTRDLDASVAFYATLLQHEPVKRFADYALFVTDDPGLELALDLDRNTPSRGDEHYGLVVATADAVGAQADRLRAAGYAVDVEREQPCCYAVQTKAWVADPEGRRWETYFVHAESDEHDACGTSCCP
jgi:catechol 2,3-dioxygenase-like lactoylglutathione lyase family enzyme